MNNMDNILCLYTAENFQVERCLAYLYYKYKKHNIYLLAREGLQNEAHELKRAYPDLSLLVYSEEHGENFYADHTSNELKSEFNKLNFVKAFVPVSSIKRGVYTIKSLAEQADDPQPIEELAAQLNIPKKSTIQSVDRFFQIFRFLWVNGIKSIHTYEDRSIVDIDFNYLLDDFKDKHKNERCFIVANGPSLKKIDISLLKDEITFGCNRIYLAFKEWGFSTTYMSIIDRLQILLYLQEWEKELPDDSTVFSPFHNYQMINMPNLCPVNLNYSWNPFGKLPEFNPHPGLQTVGGTTVHFMLQIAIIMGCNPIVIVGADNTYVIDEKQKNGRFWISEDGRNHFDPKYTENGKRLFLQPRDNANNNSFQEAAEWCRKNGVDVINASMESALPAFRKVPFDQLMSTTVSG